MTILGQAHDALARYNLGTGAEISRQLEATHAAFRVRASGRLYALRQFNAYVEPEDMQAQFALAEGMHEAGLRVSTPVPTTDGDPFAMVGERLWALFPWCDGRPGSADRLDDLTVLVSTQGAWVRCCEHLRSGSQWNTIVCRARKFRQRKSWAWVVPLDQVPRFAEEQRVIRRAQAKAPGNAGRRSLSSLLPELEPSIARVRDLFEEQSVSELPHMVTHGDFWASNICISDAGAVVLDLDCYSFEPRVTDFAKAANWYYRQQSPSENAALFRQFQAHAQLALEEAELLPLMMCAHDLYYAVSHVLMVLDEQDPAARSRTTESIRSEMEAPRRYQRERDAILRMFVGGG